MLSTVPLVADVVNQTHEFAAILALATVACEPEVVLLATEFDTCTVGDPLVLSVALIREYVTLGVVPTTIITTLVIDRADGV